MVIPEQMHVAVALKVLDLLKKILDIHPDRAGVVVSNIWVWIREFGIDAAVISCPGAMWWTHVSCANVI